MIRAGYSGGRRAVVICADQVDCVWIHAAFQGEGERIFGDSKGSEQ
jgi:hypothetical protein